MFVILAVFVGRLTVLRLEADDAGIRVVNIWRSYRLRWGEIERFSVGWAYWGITVYLRSGRPRLISAIQKSNVNLLLRRPARADEVVSEAHRHAPEPSLAVIVLRSDD